MKNKDAINALLSQYFDGRLVEIGKVFRHRKNRAIFKISVDGDDFVVTWRPKNKKVLREIDASTHFSALGISPNVVCSDKHHGVLITQYIHNDNQNIGFHLTVQHLKQLGKTLSMIHQQTALPLDTEMHRDIMRLKQIKETHAVIEKYPGRFSQIESALLEINHLSKYLLPLHYCHNDLWWENVLITTETNKMAIIDWESSGMNDQFFDLAYICVFFQLTATQEKRLLKSYYQGELPEAALEKLLLIKILVVLKSCIKIFSEIVHHENLSIANLPQLVRFSKWKPEAMPEIDLATDRGKYAVCMMLLSETEQLIKHQDKKALLTKVKNFNKWVAAEFEKPPFVRL
jgi:thiamine kinase-like enzyme